MVIIEHLTTNAKAESVTKETLPKTDSP